MKAFTDYLLKKGYSSKTANSYANTANHFSAWAEEENIILEATTNRDVLHYIQIRKKTASQRTIGFIVNGLKHYFDHLSIKEMFQSNQPNPASQIKIQGIKRKKLYHILTKQELEQLYENYPNTTPTNKRNKAILSLMIWQGLNASELFNLEAKDLKLREGKIYIAGGRKSNERELKLESVQILDLMEYQLQHRQSEKLFTSSGASNNGHNVMYKFMKGLKKQNPKVDSAKQIRTSVITHWLKTYNLREVQYMAGHRYVSSTEAYLVNDLESLSEDIEKYHPF
ncbi:MAG: hypothetical protein CL840_06490 [Crocinitomicaceae bacterium]|nr:hypothetical protein [Crocinitomicaceae bacterium]|tara:strand:- start:6737 stop:7585 length:849 start_codon:yes stop_codon:yes gene_type:complete